LVENSNQIDKGTYDSFKKYFHTLIGTFYPFIRICLPADKKSRRLQPFRYISVILRIYIDFYKKLRKFQLPILNKCIKKI